MANLLSKNERDNALSDLLETGWKLVDERDAIERKFKFKNFSEAFGWMSRVAMAAEKLDHHPEWSNVYNRVEVVLTTHSVNGLSELDLKLAAMMNDYYTE